MKITSFSSYNGYKLNSHLTCFQWGFIAQSVEHHTGIAEVMGSNPVGASEFFLTKISLSSIQYSYTFSRDSLHSFCNIAVLGSFLFLVSITFIIPRWPTLVCCRTFFAFTGWTSPTLLTPVHHIKPCITVIVKIVALRRTILKDGALINWHVL